MSVRTRPQTATLQQASSSTVCTPQPSPQWRLSRRLLARSIAAGVFIVAVAGYGALSWHHRQVYASDEVEDEKWDDADATAAVNEILASRPYEPQVRLPLADLSAPSADHCGADVASVQAIVARELSMSPHGRRELTEVEDLVTATETALQEVFQDANGYWASDAKERRAVSQASGDGPPAACGEATYGEITVHGLNAVLLALAKLGMPDGQQAPSPPFDAMVDLGAGVGRTAAAAILLRFTARSFGVELGPQRFALGCRALARAAGVAQHASSPQARLELLLGDARAWPELASKHDWPACGSGWVLYLGAQCFRDSLLDSLAQAIARGCAPGVRVAVLGRKLPTTSNAVAGSAASAKAADTQLPDGQRRRLLREQGIVYVRTTWPGEHAVYLYQLLEEAS